MTFANRGDLGASYKTLLVAVFLLKRFSQSDGMPICCCYPGMQGRQGNEVRFFCNHTWHWFGERSALGNF